MDIQTDKPTDEQRDDIKTEDVLTGVIAEQPYGAVQQQ